MKEKVSAFKEFVNGLNEEELERFETMVKEQVLIKQYDFLNPVYDKDGIEEANKYAEVISKLYRAVK